MAQIDVDVVVIREHLDELSGRINGEFYQNMLQSLVVVAVLYIVVCFALSMLARRLEVRQRRREPGEVVRV